MVNVQDAKTNLSRYLDAVEAGEVVVLCRHDKPLAEIRRIATPDATAVPRFGLFDGFGVADSFFEPLDEDVLRAFSGQ